MISGVAIRSYPNAGSLSTTTTNTVSRSSRETIEGYAMLVHAIMPASRANGPGLRCVRSEEHTSELQSLRHLVCRLLLEKKLSSDDRRLPLGVASKYKCPLSCASQL